VPDYYLNIASGHEVSIGELAHLIAELSDFDGEITYDLSKKGGDPRRCASGNLAKELIGFYPSVPLEEGLSQTIAWYREQVRLGRESELMGH
jgi:GDP-L-fucose synthase